MKWSSLYVAHSSTAQLMLWFRRYAALTEAELSVVSRLSVRLSVCLCHFNAVADYVQRFRNKVDPEIFV